MSADSERVRSEDGCGKRLIYSCCMLSGWTSYTYHTPGVRAAGPYPSGMGLCLLGDRCFSCASRVNSPHGMAVCVRNAQTLIPLEQGDRVPHTDQALYRG